MHSTLSLFLVKLPLAILFAAFQSWYCLNVPVYLITASIAFSDGECFSGQLLHLCSRLFSLIQTETSWLSLQDCMLNNFTVYKKKTCYKCEATQRAGQCVGFFSLQSFLCTGNRKRSHNESSSSESESSLRDEIKHRRSQDGASVQKLGGHKHRDTSTDSSSSTSSSSGADLFCHGRLFWTVCYKLYISSPVYRNLLILFLVRGRGALQEQVWCWGGQYMCICCMYGILCM